MKRPLESLENEARKNPTFAREWGLAYYKAWYCFCSGQYDEVEKILNDDKDSFDAVELSELKVTMLLRQDRFNEAEKIVRRMPPGYQRTAELESELIKLKYGNKKVLDYLSEKRKKCPQFSLIESKYADALVDSAQIDAATEVRKKLAHERPFDFFIQLAFASHQLYHGNFEEAKDYLVRLDYPPEVSYYDDLLAKMYSKQGLDAKAWEYIKLAKKMFPKSPYALSAIAAMAWKERDLDMQYAALKEELETDPNNIQILALMVLLHFFRNECDQALQVEKQISGSKRYVEPEIRQKLDSVKSKCMPEGTWRRS